MKQRHHVSQQHISQNGNVVVNQPQLVTAMKQIEKRGEQVYLSKLIHKTPARYQKVAGINTQFNYYQDYVESEFGNPRHLSSQVLNQPFDQNPQQLPANTAYLSQLQKQREEQMRVQKIFESENFKKEQLELQEQQLREFYIERDILGPHRAIQQQSKKALEKFSPQKQFNKWHGFDLNESFEIRKHLGSSKAAFNK